MLAGFVVLLAGVSGEWFEKDAAVFDLHGRADVDLDADEAFELAVGGVVVDDLGHDVAVEDVDEDVAADDEVVLVPVVGVDEGFEFVGGAEVGDDGGCRWRRRG